MQKRLTYFAFVLVMIVGFMTTLPTQQISAQEANTQALSVSPFLIEQRIEPGTPSQAVITVTNQSSQPVTIDIGIHDFVADEAGGAPTVLPETQRLDSSFSLASWITLAGERQRRLAPGTKLPVTITINPPLNAEPGSRYATVLFTVQTRKNNGAITTTKVGSFILTKLGNADERGNISQFETEQKISWNGQINFATRFANNGNVHLAPKGRILIYNMFGRLVESLPINSDALILLPKTHRTFTANWKPKLALGRYTAEIRYTYGESRLEAVSTLNFWIITTKQVILIALVLIGTLMALIIGIKRYNAWIIRRSQR